MTPCAAAAALVLALALPAAAAELEHGTWHAGVDIGLGLPFGGAASNLGGAVATGGQAFLFPDGESGLGLQVAAFRHAGKNGNGGDAAAVMAAGRVNIETDAPRTMPYALACIGYAESHASPAGGGSDRGSGPGFGVGAGYEVLLSRAFSVAAEGRFLRLMAPLPSLGLSGITVAAIVFRVNFMFRPADPFG